MGSQFPKPAPELEGYGELVASPGTPTFMFSIGNYLEVSYEELVPIISSWIRGL